MSDINTSKVDGNTVSASEFNQLAEIDNLISTSGQTPSTANLEQQAIASARYSSAGNFFTDSGTANAYVLSPVSPFKSPVSSVATETYFNGMVIRFRAGNACSGASNVNVNNAGSKSLVKSDGSTALTTGDIPANTEVEFVYNGTNFVQSLGNVPATTTTQGVVFRKAPTIQKFTSGSGTYTTPAEVLYLKIKMVGGGGGGAGSGTIVANNHGSGANGGNTTFGTSLLTCNGGAGGGGAGSGAGGLGGTATINSPAYGTPIAGGAGVSSGSTTTGQSQFGGAGASSYFGGASGRGDVASVANSGSGGAAGTAFSSSYLGGSGGAGAFIDAIIPTPSATYAYSIGSAGASGAAGTGGNAGSTGGAGYIEVTEFYN
jgi:hypothetical protein